MATKSERIVCDDNGCHKATRVTKTLESFRSTPNSIVAIDFGTTHCSVSSLLEIKTHPNISALKPSLLKLDNEDRKRVPSCILFDNSGKMKSFGKKARDQYAKLPKTEIPGYTFFEHVKKEVQRTEVSLSMHARYNNIVM